jgi:DNA uptake protein ComE-like DNA-binding protein
MHNADRNRQEVMEHGRHWHSGPTEQGQTLPEGETTADTQSIDLNHATWQQLADVDDLGEACARAIVEHRTFHGHFRTWEDVATVEGMSAERVRALQHAARIGGIETPVASG